MAVNIKFYYTLTSFALAAMGLAMGLANPYAATAVIPVEACVVARNMPLTPLYREKLARCLGWHTETSSSICHGFYQPLQLPSLADEDEIHIMANDVSLYQKGRSTLQGNVEVHQVQRIVNAQTAYIYRDATTNKITHIELLGDVRYLEPDRQMIAQRAMINRVILRRSSIDFMFNEQELYYQRGVEQVGLSVLPTKIIYYAKPLTQLVRLKIMHGKLMRAKLL